LWTAALVLALAGLSHEAEGRAPAGADTAARTAAKGSRFLHEPDVGRSAIVFVSGGDLWTAPLAGGRATRLTSEAGRETSPRFSPDGSRIAFSGEKDGNVDVYVVAAAGGRPTRLTFHPANERVEGWSPDGRSIVFSSDRGSEHFLPRLHTVPASGGHPSTFTMHKGFRASYSPDGKRLAYTPIRDAFITWKRNRGGQTTPIWIVDLADYSHTEIPHQNASDTSPVWMGGTVYFLSDRNDVMSLFAYDVSTRQVTELFQNGGTDIDSLAGARGRLVLSSGGHVYLYDVAKRKAHQVSIVVADDREETAPGMKNVSEEIRSVVLSPDGSQVAIEAHGEVLTMSSAGGAFRNLTASPGAAERQAAWSPDGTRIAYFSDEGGEYALHVRAVGGGAATRVGQGEPGLGRDTTWAPDGKRIGYVDRFQKLWYADLTGGGHTAVPESQTADPYSWSPDGRVLAYAHLHPTRFRTLRLFDLDSGRVVSVTDGVGDAHRPAFARDGKSLFFLGSTSAGKAKTGLDLSVGSHENEVTWSVYALRMPSRTSASGPAAFARSIEKLPVPEGRYVHLDVAADGALLLSEEPSEHTFGGKPRLRRFDPTSRKLEDLVEGVRFFDLSADGKTALYRADKTWDVLPVGTRPVAGAARALDTARLEVRVEPRQEWRQMFVEGWRNQRDFFYDESLHGVDWKAMRQQYESYLPDLRYRSDLTFVLRHLVGELVNSHIGVEGPRAKVEKTPVGLLGADYEIVGDRYRVKRIVMGSYWNGEASPLAAPGVDVKEGDYILEVDGKDLRHPTSIDSLLVGGADRPVTLRVGAEPCLEGSRSVTVVPVGSEGPLRHREWIEGNRRKVDQLSNGRIAYVYQPDTSEGSLREFDRYFFPQSDRVAVILDERFNRGGGDPDYQLDVLDRQQVHWYRQRNEPPFKSPFSIVAGPKVMLVNAEASSGGDVYPYQFKIRKLGTTVGTRTWGGVQGGGAGAPLMDGGFVRVPNLGTYAPDGSYILENVGFVPDVEVQIFPKDDAAGRDPQLEKAVEIVLEELRRNPPRAVPELQKVDRSLKAATPRSR
jgi:tricorn protease